VAHDPCREFKKLYKQARQWRVVTGSVPKGGIAALLVALEYKPG
jgi:hypothetical protein